ncbi:MAG TPA: amino acid adenylation domain-containing protein, partial [Hyphomicrobiales bacterium]|nr:amino acid adenylation domain-containing protein [Hyphomicrobiales bacterium]
ELQAVIAHCDDNSAVTPADFPLVTLTQAQLDALPLPPHAIEDIYPLSPMQQGMLFHTLQAPEEGTYLNQLRVDVEGPLDSDRFLRAWQDTLERHPVLRAGFLWEGVAQPIQLIHRQVAMPTRVHDWREGNLERQVSLREALTALAQSRLKEGFDLRQAPLQSLDLVRTAPDCHHLIYTSHHILMDGWATSQLFGEVLQRYRGEPPAASISGYRDYLRWLQTRDAVAAEHFWREQLAPLEEPTLLGNAIASDARGDAGQKQDYRCALSVEETAQLSAFAREQQVTLNSVLQAAWLLLLQRYTGQDTVTFGATVAGRPAEIPGIEQQIGLFINTLPVVARVEATEQVGDWVRRVQAVNLALREHEHTPLYEIQRWAGHAGSALFDTLVVFENYPIAEALREGNSTGLRFSHITSHEQTNYGVTLAVGLSAQLALHFSYDNQQFSDEVMARLGRQLLGLLRTLAEDASQAVGNLALLAPEEEVRVLRQWNGATVAYEGVCVHRLFEAQVAKAPNAIAVTLASREHEDAAADAQLSYAVLNARANRLAHRLQRLGVGPDVLVGIAVERSLEMVVGLLAILKAGGAYVPLDPAYPADRLQYMMEDSGIALLLSQESLSDALPIPEGIQVLCLDGKEAEGEAGWAHEADTNLAQAVDPDNLAYVIYTSGSTGKPKGALLAHRNVSRLMQATEQWFHFNETDVWTLFHSYAFDFSVWEIFGALVYGGKLVVVPRETARATAEFHRLLCRYQVTVLNQTPSAFRSLMELICSREEQSNETLALRHVIFGGEALAVESLFPWFERFGDYSPQLTNMYGITETTVHVTYRPVTATEKYGSPIGTVIPDLDWYVLNIEGQPIGPGCSGELHIGGAGLARGYHGRAALTAERFVPNPFDSQGGRRLYRTGDLAQYRADGAIEYVGRLDHQVKIRGFRIELGEIEAQLWARPALRNAVVLAQPGVGGPQLVTYLVPHDGTLVMADGETQSAFCAGVKAQLQTALPEYMVPAQYLLLDHLPLTPNGKLDRKALPTMEGKALQRMYEAPATPLEEQLAAIWRNVLGIERVGRKDNFFELGGHSLLLVRMISLVKSQLSVELPNRDYYTAGSIEELAEKIRGFKGNSAQEDYALIANVLDELEENDA